MQTDTELVPHSSYLENSMMSDSDTYENYEIENLAEGKASKTQNTTSENMECFKQREIYKESIHELESYTDEQWNNYVDITNFFKHPDNGFMHEEYELNSSSQVTNLDEDETTEDFLNEDWHAYLYTLADQYPETPDNNDPFLYPGSNLKLSISLLLHLALATKHNLSGEALNDVLFLSSLHCKRPNNAAKSVNQLQNYFSLSGLNYTKYHYCGKCCFILENFDKDKVCPKCKRMLETMLDILYFLP